MFAFTDENLFDHQLRLQVHQTNGAGGGEQQQNETRRATSPAAVTHQEHKAQSGVTMVETNHQYFNLLRRFTL